MKLDNFLDRLCQDSCPESLWQTTTVFLADNGFDRVIRIRTSQSGVDVRTTMSTGFQAFYAENAFERDDPFLKYCLTAPNPVATGEAYLKDYDYLTARCRQLICAAGEDGFRAGFSVPSPAYLSGQTIGWNLGSSLDKKEVEALRRDREPVLRLALMAVQDRLDHLPERLPEPHGSDISCLSNREHQCLALIAKGLRIKAIAGELGIKPVTVELHLANARRKLGAATRDQAVAMVYAHHRPSRHPPE